MQKSLVFVRKSPIFLFWSTFLIFGNFFRILPLAPFPSSFSILELLLYAWALPPFLLRARWSYLIFLSALYGVLLHGPILSSILYGFRLFAMIGAGHTLGIYLTRFDLQTMLTKFLKPYTYLSLLGFLIFFLFPHADPFFHFLTNFGVTFRGDPHIRRFISPLFDPNYYCAIAVLPLYLAWHIRNRPLALLFAITILLTWSRSGIATACLMFILIHNRSPRMKTALISLLLLLFYRAEALHFITRLIGWLDDPSAQARFTSFAIAIHFFLRFPFFGMGYNFLSSFYSQELTNLAPDSSFFLTLTCFGLIPTLVTLIVFTYFLLKLWKKTPHPLLQVLYIYLAICILFTSQFNNLLYYPYWLVPMIALFTYFNKRDLAP